MNLFFDTIIQQKSVYHLFSISHSDGRAALYMKLKHVYTQSIGTKICSSEEHTVLCLLCDHTRDQSQQSELELWHFRCQFGLHMSGECTCMHNISGGSTPSCQDYNMMLDGVWFQSIPQGRTRQCLSQWSYYYRCPLQHLDTILLHSFENMIAQSSIVILLHPCQEGHLAPFFAWKHAKIVLAD